VSELPQWRVSIWYLTSNGWENYGRAFLKAKDYDHALAYGIAQAANRGLRVTKDTEFFIREEVEGDRLS
jgi:hypothetical protein